MDGFVADSTEEDIQGFMFAKLRWVLAIAFIASFT